MVGGGSDIGYFDCYCNVLLCKYYSTVFAVRWATNSFCTTQLYRARQRSLVPHTNYILKRIISLTIETNALSGMLVQLDETAYHNN